MAGTGCNAATGIYGILPLLRAGVIDPDDIIIDLATGVSGAGRSPKEGMLHSEVSEGYHAYNVAKHRHLAEFDQEFAKAAGRKVEVTFVPHLLPQNRGILATIYVRGEAEAIHAALAAAYAGEPFIVVLPLGEAPATRHVRGSNFVHLGRHRRPAAGAGDGVLRPRQPDQGILGPGDPERQPDARPARDHGADGGAPLPVRRLKRVFRVIWVAYDRFNRNDGWSMSGFIAFSGLLSLFPFLIFAATLIGILVGAERSDSDHRGAVRDRARRTWRRRWRRWSRRC